METWRGPGPARRPLRATRLGLSRLTWLHLAWYRRSRPPTHVFHAALCSAVTLACGTPTLPRTGKHCLSSARQHCATQGKQHCATQCAVFNLLVLSGFPWLPLASLSFNRLPSDLAHCVMLFPIINTMSGNEMNYGIDIKGHEKT